MDVKRPLTATTAAQHGSQAETGMAVVDWSSEAIVPLAGAGAGRLVASRNWRYTEYARTGVRDITLLRARPEPSP